MKFSLSLLALLPLAALAVPQPADVWYHTQLNIGPTMWGFGATGIKMYSIDGTEIVKSLSSFDICDPYSRSQDTPGSNCGWYDYATDGKKYVYASTYSMGAGVHVYSIDTGEFVTAIPTCGTPLNLDYHPGREELTVRCASGPHIDYISTNALSFRSELTDFNLTAGSRGYGRQIMDSTLGNFGYATLYNSPTLYKIDLNTREPSQEFDLPGVVGLYDMSYSAVNKHIFLRTRVCCTCGEGYDTSSCGRGTPSSWDDVTQYGPFVGQTGVNGTSLNATCGGGCEGSTADTIGLYEWDTVTETVVGQHNLAKGYGGANPFSSSSGEYTMMFGSDGGESLRILKSGQNGEKSTVYADIPVDFAGASNPRSDSIRDFAFIKDDTREIGIFVTGSDSDILLVDLSSQPVQWKKLPLNQDGSNSAPGASRTIEWAVGSNFVWVGGVGADSTEQYILDVPSANIDDIVVKKTIPDTESTRFVYVENYMNRISAKEVAVTDEESSVDESSSSDESSSADTTGTAALRGTPDDDDDGMPIAAIVLAALALVVSLASFALVLTRPAGGGKSGNDGDKSLASNQIE